MLIFCFDFPHCLLCNVLCPDIYFISVKIQVAVFGFWRQLVMGLTCGCLFVCRSLKLGNQRGFYLRVLVWGSNVSELA